MKRLTVMTLLTLWACSALGSVLPEQWLRVGQAELKMLWFDIYHAELLTADGRYRGREEPLLLRLTYKRDISRQSLLRETEKELLRFADKQQVNIWVEQLAGFWTGVREGDQLAFYQSQSGEGHFFYNGRWLGAMQGTAFARAFSGIWLSEQSRFPDLAASLRGENSNDHTD